jgi:hypothetical protein
MWVLCVEVFGMANAAETLKTGVKICNSKKGMQLASFCGGALLTKCELWGKSLALWIFF